jgi:hypothetical protein
MFLRPDYQFQLTHAGSLRTKPKKIMKNNIRAMLVLAGLMTLSCEKMELNKSDNRSLLDLESPTLKEGLLAPACKTADAIVGRIAITSVVGNTFEFSFLVANVGAGTLYLNRMYFQAYVSEDATLDPSDQPAGGSIFGDTAPTLAYGETYTQDWYYNPTTPVDLTQYNYVIVQVLVRAKFSMPECTLANNIAAKSIGCVLADASISSVNITNVNASTNTFDYTFTVTNTGWATLPLNQLFFQTYVSKDAVLGAGDQPAGGSIFGNSAPALAKNESYSQAWYYNPTTPEDLTEYKYLIIQLNVWSGAVPECSTDNNTVASRIVIDIPRNGLVAFYPFNNNANDESGNNLNGVVNGATGTTDRFSNGNKAYSFDGIDDYIDIGNPAALQIINSITLSVWVRNTSFNFGRILSKTQPTNTSNTQEGHGYQLRLTQTGDGSNFYGAYILYPSGSIPIGLNFAAGAPFTTNAWVNFTFTLSGQNAKWYKDGVEVFAVNVHRPLTAASLGDFVIGRSIEDGSQFNGLIDDVAIYNRALSAVEIQQLYNQNISQ